MQTLHEMVFIIRYSKFDRFDEFQKLQTIEQILKLKIKDTTNKRVNYDNK